MNGDSGPAVRRIVTGTDPAGRSMIVSDGSPTRTVSWHPAPTRPSMAIVWGYDDAAQAARGTDETDVITAFFPPRPGGTRFLIERFDPGYGVDRAKSVLIREALDRAGLGLVMSADEAGGIHATATIDYGIVLAGRIRLVTDTSMVVLGAGDVVVQTGVRHAWRNDFDEPCDMAFVLVGVEHE